METFSFTVYLFLLLTQIRKDLIVVHASHITMEPPDGQRDFLMDCEATGRCDFETQRLTATARHIRRGAGKLNVKLRLALIFFEFQLSVHHCRR